MSFGCLQGWKFHKISQKSMPLFDHPHANRYSLYLIRIFLVQSCACCLFSYCCMALSLPLSSVYPPIRQLWIAIRSLTSLLFSRLKRPSSLSLSLCHVFQTPNNVMFMENVMFSRPLIITGFAPVCLNSSEYPKVDTKLQRES